MSEYQTEADVEKFIYKVSDSVGKHPFGIRLFDEIEKHIEESNGFIPTNS